MAGSVSQEKLERRRRELHKRKYSFVELIMQTRKNLYKDKLEQLKKVQEDGGPPEGQSS